MNLIHEYSGSAFAPCGKCAAKRLKTPARTRVGSSWAVAILGCILAGDLKAQEPLPALPVVEPLPQEVGPASMIGEENALLDMNAAESAAIDAAETPEAVLDAPNPGPPAPKWKVMPHIDVSVMWDDNIFIQPENEIEDFLFTFSPGLTIGYIDEESRLERFLEREVRASRAVQYDGNFFLLDYTPSFVVFLDNDSENSFDQDARFEARWQLQKLSLAAQASFISKNETNTELGTRLRHEAVAASVSGRYQFTERVSAELGGYFQDDDYQDASGNTEYRTEAFVSYAVSPVVEFGVGVAFGLVEVENGQNQTFERLLARGSYELTEKVAVRALAGVEYRQSDGDAEDQTNPVFEVELAYVPAELTRVGFRAFRRVTPSISAPEDSVETTGVALTFSRTLRTGLRFLAEVGYEFADFTESGVGGSRSDDFFFGRTGLIYNFATWGSAGVSYEYRNNDSSRSASGFTNNQITFDVSLTF